MNNLQPWPFVSFSEERVPSFQQLVRGLMQKTLLRISGLADRVGTLAHWGAGTGTQGPSSTSAVSSDRAFSARGTPVIPPSLGLVSVTFMSASGHFLGPLGWAVWEPGDESGQNSRRSHRVCSRCLRHSNLSHPTATV